MILSLESLVRSLEMLDSLPNKGRATPLYSFGFSRPMLVITLSRKPCWIRIRILLLPISLASEAPCNVMTQSLEVFMADDSVINTQGSVELEVDEVVNLGIRFQLTIRIGFLVYGNFGL